MIRQISPEAVTKHGQIRCNYTHFWWAGDYNTTSRVYVDFASGSKVADQYASELTGSGQIKDQIT